jgi:DNA gyrase/topoisomerase IV subunit A
MRAVIELKRGEVAEIILNNLYKETQMQTASASTWSRWSMASPPVESEADAGCVPAAPP